MRSVLSVVSIVVLSTSLANAQAQFKAGGISKGYTTSKTLTIGPASSGPMDVPAGHAGYDIFLLTQACTSQHNCSVRAGSVILQDDRSNPDQAMRCTSYFPGLNLGSSFTCQQNDGSIPCTCHIVGVSTR